MIRKIEGSEYLKRYDNMEAQEREEYEKRIGQWLTDYGQMLARRGEVFEASMQNVLQVSVGWNDQECQAFEEGVRLLSALTSHAETWLPDMLYVKSAKRAIKRMVEVLWNMEAELTPPSEVPGNPDVPSTEGEPISEDQAQTIWEKYGISPAPFQDGAGDGDIAGGDNEGEVQVKTDAEATVALVPPRPKHIDQYVHLLPKKTQEHAALVQGLYRELDEARQKMELLMNDETASAADREAWAKKATKCDNTLRKIFDELDAEWAKLVKAGRVVVDDLGMARVAAADTEEEPEEPAELTSEQKARRRELRKWLTDTRRGNGAGRDERVKQWKVNFKEYLTLEGDKAFEDEKIKEAIAHYGIDVEVLKAAEPAKEPASQEASEKEQKEE